MFNVEGRFYQFMVQFKDLLILNFMWVLFSIPIITAGASTTAACAVAMKMYRNEEGYIARMFVKEFKRNLKKGTIAWLIMLFVMYVIYLDNQIIKAMENPPIFLFIASIAAVVLLVVCFLYTFALLARYENSVWNSMKNSYQLILRYFGRTIFMVLVLGILYVVLTFSRTMLYFMIVIGPGMLIYTYGAFAIQLFEKIEKEHPDSIG